MRQVRELASEGVPSATLELPFDERRKSRVRARLDDGQEVGIFLPRGTVMRDGALLRASDGGIIAVRSARERVSTVRAEEAEELARIAYHLGNRHLAVEIGPGFVRYERDHVIDEMVQRLGGAVVHEQTPFEPRTEAYEDHDAAG